MKTYKTLSKRKKEYIDLFNSMYEGYSIPCEEDIYIDFASDGDVIVSVIGILPLGDEVEVFGITKPGYTGVGHFKRLLAKAKRMLEGKIVIYTLAPSTKPKATPYSSHYLMQFKREDISIPSTPIEYSANMRKHMLTLYKSNGERKESLGHLKFTEEGSLGIFIYQVYIKKGFRHMGYGKILLNYLISTTEYDRYTLEVTGENIPAFELYKKLGFKIIDSIIYYRL